MNDAFLALRQRYPQADTLSMGMTDDMAAAIAAGSTLVRIGTAILAPATTRRPDKQTRDLMQHRKITFIGAGNMARAIIAGLVAGGYPAKSISVCAPSAKTVTRWRQTTASSAAATTSPARARPTWWCWQSNRR